MVFKSDVEVKQKFIEKLLGEGFDAAEVKAKPADIVAQKDGVTWYYEIKLTDKTDTYFGAATLTEWEQALKTPEYYRFVIAIRHQDGHYEFREFTPAEFMMFSTIPPFKVYFNISLDGKHKHKKRRSAIPMSEENLQHMLDVFKVMREGK